MKSNVKNILSWLALMLMFILTSCRDDTFADYFDNSDEFTVTFDVGLEGMSPVTRGDDQADGDDGVRIGSGSKIDMLVYAVYYDANKDPQNPRWEEATEYQKKYDDGEYPFDREPGYGQTILDVSETLGKGEKRSITLTLKKGQEYRVVFWAQNSQTEAFVIDDLRKVQMKYKVLHEKPMADGSYVDDIHSVNNDEARDAFCRSVSLSGDQAKRNITIYLRRPLAQINVGTRGFDFESITRNADVGEKYLYSKIRINRAARYLNVVTDEIYTTTTETDNTDSSTEAFYTIDYEYNRIPAYWKWEEGEMPKYPSYTIYDKENATDAYSTFFRTHTEMRQEGVSNEDRFKQLYGKEEFLKVHLYDRNELQNNGEEIKEDKEGYITYSGMGNTMTEEDGKNRSEVFKYLSMCYVLTNSSDDYQDVLTNVKVWMAKDVNGRDSVEIANIAQVPVQRNHRTNIVGSLLTAKADMQIVVDNDFAGRKIHGNSNVQSGEITEGFYYDADADEFQISSVNGLLFFQQLVNGDLIVRQESNNPVSGVVSYLGKPYPYYTDNDETTYSLKYKSHTFSELGEDKANIIIYGSKYDKFNNGQQKVTVDGKTWTIKVEKDANGWPKMNNFPFYGAKVKLMADIDLSGIEWIPIGFDCANWDSTFGEMTTSGGYDNYNNNNKTFNYISLNTNTAEVSLGFRRAFCGTFDGNGHTIYNMKTKNFGANIHPSAYQDYGPNNNSNLHGPFDCVQWFAKGFFGVTGPGIIIKDLRLQNVNVQGYNAVGAIVGQVSSVGFPAKIQNCAVDMGEINVEPLYRGDYAKNHFYGRTMARGCYIGGVVGQFVAKDDVKNNTGLSEITGCEVRNVTIIGYRRMGGIVGSIGDHGSAVMSKDDVQIAITVENNSVANSTFVLNQYRAFTYFYDYISGDKDGTWQNGFGWPTGDGYAPCTDYIVGGYFTAEDMSSVNSSTLDMFTENGYRKTRYYEDKDGNILSQSFSNKTQYFTNYVNQKNSITNIQLTSLSTQPNVSNRDPDIKASYRESIVRKVPMKYIPMFTSLFVDRVTLNENYYGESVLRTKLHFYESPIWLFDKDLNKSETKFSIPINFPNGSEITYLDQYYDKTAQMNKKSGYVGMYAETVDINGSNAPGGRSVITPTGVDGENSCVMYITARDRSQFLKSKPVDNLATTDKIGNKWKQPTNVRNVVLRGSPYAWAGIVLAPNKNMSAVNLNDVTIYDVYKTLALQEVNESGEYQNYTKWTDASVDLNVTNCNLRGYTVPGAGWNKVNYVSTTFEQGAETKYSYETMIDPDTRQLSNRRNEFRTVKVETQNTNFRNCFFKAPFYIDLATLTEAQRKNVTFYNCKATSAYNDVKVDPSKYSNVYYIGIDKSTEKGKTIVTYYGANGKVIATDTGS